MEIPHVLGEASVLAYAAVAEDVMPTGRTRHLLGAVPVDGELVGGVLMPPAVALAIAQYPGDAGFYLFGLDRLGEVQSDTWHESLEDARDQAEWEYEGLVWETPSR